RPRTRIGRGPAPRAIWRRHWRAGKSAPSPRRSPSAPARPATPSRRKDRERHCAAPRSRFRTCSTEPCACASKTATWLSRRSRPCLSRPRSRTIRPSTPASTRSSPETRQAQPEAPARAWITAWLATALWGARFAKPLSTPTQPTRRSQKGDISTRPEKGTLLLCLDTHLFYTRARLAGRALHQFTQIVVAAAMMFSTGSQMWRPAHGRRSGSPPAARFGASDLQGACERGARFASRKRAASLAPGTGTAPTGLPSRQPLRRLGDALHGADVDEGGELGVRLAPLGERRFEAPCALLGQPDGPAAGVACVGRRLDQPFALQHLQIARQRRRIKARALRQRAERIVARRGDLRHEPELSDAELRRLHVVGQELGQPARGEACVPDGARLNRGADVGHELLFQREPCIAGHSMHIHYLYLQWKGDDDHARHRRVPLRRADPEAIAALTGTDFLQAIIRGELPAPPMAKTLDFFLVEVGD